MRILFRLLIIAILSISAVHAQDFVQYQNSFTNGGAIAIGSTGEVWYQCGAQLINFDPQSTLVRRYNLPSSYPGSIAIDGSGAVWVFCGGTIFRMFEGSALTFPLMGGNGRVMAAAPDGSVWVNFYLNRNFLIRYHNGSWEEVPDVPST
ncbi:MAG: hypothetical protein JW941_09445, partial [Candidatus Coatesbacteria bacterium]|nr:hypothetical protein [Candidatus Coatesbacteria bacterium]